MKKVLVLIIVLICFGCATPIYVEVNKPSEVDMTGARNLVIEDAKYIEDEVGLGDIFNGIIMIGSAINSEETGPYLYRHEAKVREKVINYTSSRIKQAFKNTSYFTLHDESSQYSDNTEVQALFKSNLKNIKIDAEKYYEDVTVYNEETEDEETIQELYCKYRISYQYKYRVVSIVDKSTITSGTYNKSDEITSKYNERGSIDLISIFKGYVNSISKDITKKLAPYVVAETRYLLKDKAKDPELKEANSLAYDQYYKESFDIYYDNWKRTHNPAAGYNAAILYEALGNIEQAVELMKEVVSVTNNEDAVKEYSRLKMSLNESNVVKKQFGT